MQHPLSRATPAPHEVPISENPAGRALVVDDDDVNRLVATALLRHLGFEADTACDGADAIAKCMQAPPTLVLMDVHMPQLDGLDATRCLRALQREGRLPRFAIIAATAGQTAHSEGDCLAAGMDAHLLKPLSVDGLRAALRRLVPGSGRA